MTSEEVRDAATKQAARKGHNVTWRKVGTGLLGGPDYRGQCVRCAEEIAVATHGVWVTPGKDLRTTTCAGRF